MSCIYRHYRMLATSAGGQKQKELSNAELALVKNALVSLLDNKPPSFAEFSILAKAWARCRQVSKSKEMPEDFKWLCDKGIYAKLDNIYRGI
jgi:hypothetical protein